MTVSLLGDPRYFLEHTLTAQCGSALGLLSSECRTLSEALFGSKPDTENFNCDNLLTPPTPEFPVTGLSGGRAGWGRLAQRNTHGRMA